MNIRLDQNGKASSFEDSENIYSTYSKNSVRQNYIIEKNTSVRNAESGAFSVQFGNQNKNNIPNAYDYKDEDQSGLNNLAEKMQSAHQDMMTVMSGEVSSKELGKLDEEGYDIYDMDPEETVTVVDRIKAVMAKSGVVIEGYNDDVSDAALEEVAGSVAAAEALTGVTNMASKIEKPDDGAIKYLVKNEMMPTFENLYKAEHSGETAIAYDENDKELAKYISEIMPKVEEVITGAGYEINDETKADAGWMIANELPLTPESFINYEEIKALSLPISEADAIATGLAAIKNGKNPMSAIPYDTKSNEEKAIEKIDELEGIIDETDSELKNEGIDPEEILDRYPVSDIKEGTSDRKPEMNISGDQMRTVSYRIKLEETRMFMTVSNTAFLIKHDIKIDFSELDTLINNLKTAEETQNEALYRKGSPELNRQADDLFKTANKMVSEIPFLPAAGLGIAVKSSITIESFYAEATVKKNDYVAAGLKYEALMTEVRTDLGDSITKAFRNIEDLLSENGIDITEENKKAARILGYNEMAITSENIDRVRDADMKLERVVRKLTPSATLSLIRDGINPINMDLDELEARLNERQNPNEDAEKYSAFLVRLEQRKEISAEERDGFIGIYRMLHQIEKRDDAAVGALLSQGGDMTLKNLLTQVRNRNAGGKEYVINDSFGFLDKEIDLSSSITEQISRAFESEESKQVLYKETMTDVNDMAELAEKDEPVYNEIINLLDTAGLKRGLGNMKSARSLINDRGLMLRGLRKAICGSDKNTADTEALEEVLNDVRNISGSFTDGSSAKLAYENMASRMNEIMSGAVFNVSDISGMKDISAAMGALNLSVSLARNEHFEVPMEIGGEEGSVSLHFVNDNEATPKVNIYTQTESYGRISAEFVYTETGFAGSVMSDRASSLSMLKDNMSDLEVVLSARQITVSSIEYTENINAGLASVFNPSEASESPDRIGNIKRQLYEISKEFLKRL